MTTYIEQTEIKNKLVSRKGQIVTIHTKRPMKVTKGQPTIEKESIFQCRIGVTYDNIKAVQEKRESGELPEENQGLNGFVWEGDSNVILKSIKSEELYVRCTKMKSNVAKTKYLMNGKEVDKDLIKPMCLAAEFPKTERDNDVFNIKLESILELKG